MSRLSAKLRSVGAADGYTAGGIAHWCPGCKRMHALAIDGYNSSGAKWTWDGNVDAPTCAPSVHIKWGRQARSEMQRGRRRLSLFPEGRKDRISRRLHSRAPRPDGSAS